MRVRHAILAAALVASAVLVPAGAAHADNTVTIDGVTYTIIAEGSFPAPADIVKMSRPGLAAAAPGGIACEPSSGSGAEAHLVDWQALLAGGAIHYRFLGAGSAWTGYCASSVTARATVTDVPVVGTGNPNPGAPVSATVAGDANHYGEATVPNGAPASVLTSYYTTLPTPDRSQVLGSVVVRTEGRYVNFVDGQTRTFACRQAIAYFTVQPTGPVFRYARTSGCSGPSAALSP